MILSQINPNAVNSIDKKAGLLKQYGYPHRSKWQFKCFQTSPCFRGGQAKRRFARCRARLRGIGLATTSQRREAGGASPRALPGRPYADWRVSIFTKPNINGFAGKNRKLNGISDGLRNHTRAATSRSRPCRCFIALPFTPASCVPRARQSRLGPSTRTPGTPPVPPAAPRAPAPSLASVASPPGTGRDRRPGETTRLPGQARIPAGSPWLGPPRTPASTHYRGER